MKKMFSECSEFGLQKDMSRSLHLRNRWAGAHRYSDKKTDDYVLVQVIPRYEILWGTK